MSLNTEAALAVGDAVPLLRRTADDLAHDAQLLPDLNRAASSALLSVIAMTACERATRIAPDHRERAYPSQRPVAALVHCLERLIQADPPETDPVFLEFVHEVGQLVVGLHALAES